MSTLPITLEDKMDLLRKRHGALIDVLHKYKGVGRYSADYKAATDMMNRVIEEQHMIRTQMMDKEPYSYDLHKATGDAEKLLDLFSEDVESVGGWW